MTRAELRTKALKTLAIARMAAAWTPTQKDDEAVELIASLFENPENFERICNLLNIPIDPPTM